MAWRRCGWLGLLAAMVVSGAVKADTALTYQEIAKAVALWREVEREVPLIEARFALKTGAGFRLQSPFLDQCGGSAPAFDPR